MILLILAVANTFLPGQLGAENSIAPFAITVLHDLDVASNTGEKPQSKAELYRRYCNPGFFG